MRIILILSLLLVAISCSNKNTQTETVKIKPKGEYSQISIEEQKSTIEKLKSSDINIQNETAKLVLQNPNSYNPPVLYNLSYYLFQNGRKREAAFWFYTGQLRATYDGNRCNDKTAAQAVTILNQYFGTPINTYGFEDIDNLESIINEVADYVRNNSENYDNKWINLHGIEAFLNEDKELSKPENEWGEIKSQTISDYMKGFNEAISSMKK